VKSADHVCCEKVGADFLVPTHAELDMRCEKVEAGFQLKSILKFGYVVKLGYVLKLGLG
jgi:hypothetical protein